MPNKNISMVCISVLVTSNIIFGNIQLFKEDDCHTRKSFVVVVVVVVVIVVIVVLDNLSCSVAASNFISVSKTPSTHFIGTYGLSVFYMYTHRESTFQCWMLIIKRMIWLRCSCRQPIFEAHSTIAGDDPCTHIERGRVCTKRAYEPAILYKRKYKGKSNNSNNSSSDWNIHIVNNSATSSKSRNKNK